MEFMDFVDGQMYSSQSPDMEFNKGCRLVINIETVCSNAVKKQDGNTCYKE